MRSVTTDGSILSRRFLTCATVSAHCSEEQLLNSCVHICEEENSAADAAAWRSRTFRVCAQKMEEPGVAECRGQDRRWCNRISKLYLDWIYRSAWQHTFCLDDFLFRCTLPSLFFHRVQVKPKETEMKSNKWNENVNSNTENDWFFSRSCRRRPSELWTIELPITTSPRSHFRLDWKHCKLEHFCIQAAGRKEEAKQIFFFCTNKQGQTNVYDAHLD